MLNIHCSKHVWPEDPAWPDPFGDDPYDISSL
jgi:hypothetical protein